MKKQSLMRRKMRRERIMKRTAMRFIYVSLFLVIGSLVRENQELKETINQKDIEYQALAKEKTMAITNLHYIINDLSDENESLNSIINDMDDQLKAVASVNESYVDELNTLRKRSELYNKYEYAVMYDDERTELTYEEIEYGEDLMLAKGLDPDLMFGTIMVESRGNPNAVNKTSGATGYGQFLNSTGRWVWKDLLGNNTYHSDIRKDGESNILMMATYYDYLYSEVGNTFNVVKSYSGNSTNEGTEEYLSNVNSFTRQVGEVVN